MKFLFWTFWTIDLLGTGLVLFGAGARSGLGIQNIFTSFHFWAILLGLTAVTGGLLLRFALKMPALSLVAVALPLLAGFIYYLIDSKRNNV